LPPQGFQSLRVLTLESRRAAEISRLIETYGGIPVSAPAMREIPLSKNTQALNFARELEAGSFDLVIFLTGVGARALLQTIEEAQSSESFLENLQRVKIAVRGPKPFAVMREWNVPVAVSATEPNTWRELLTALDATGIVIRGCRIAVQEYGVPNPDLLGGLQERGAVVTSVPVYQWALPEDVAPLRNAIGEILAGGIDVALFTTGVQITHLFQLASESKQEERLREALGRVLIASIGPSTSETLERCGLRADLEPSHPKMGFLVKEAAERASDLLLEKRGANSGKPSSEKTGCGKPGSAAR
jgi:uroporphyrinogen-III synthase